MLATDYFLVFWVTIWFREGIAGCHPKPRDVNFGRYTLSFLGHIISANGVSPDLNKAGHHQHEDTNHYNGASIFSGHGEPIGQIHPSSHCHQTTL